MKKSGLTMMLAIGKPKSRNPDGVSSGSTTSPDQGDGMAPGQSMDDETGEEMGGQGDSAGDEGEQGEDMLQLPPGFKPPASADGGGYFTTTIYGCIMQTANGPMLKVDKVGDMPLHGGKEEEGSMPGEEEESEAPSDEQPDQSQQPALSEEGAMYAKKKKDEMAAKKVFQPGR